jgi:hypothetical protein
MTWKIFLKSIRNICLFNIILHNVFVIKKVRGAAFDQGALFRGGF